MFGIFRSKKMSNREDFESFLFKHSATNPSISIEELLEQYIQKHDLALPQNADEPAKETFARTKLNILETSSLSKNCNDPHFQNYLANLKSLVGMYENMSPQAKKLMKEKERPSEGVR